MNIGLLIINVLSVQIENILNLTQILDPVLWMVKNLIS